MKALIINGKKGDINDKKMLMCRMFIFFEKWNCQVHEVKVLRTKDEGINV
jgi:hypothetical protein